MTRRNRPERKKIYPDTRYGSVEVQNFINYVMRDGKKSLATHLVYDAMNIIEQRTKKNPLEVIEEALKMYLLLWKSSLAEWEARHIKFLWKSLRTVVLLLRHGGFYRLFAHVRARVFLTI